MRVFVIAIGRMKDGPERDLAERYRKRFDDLGRGLGFRAVSIHEIAESRAREARTRIAEEGAALAAAIPAGAVVAMLDEHGENLGSEQFARRLAQWRDNAHDIVFIIGGADGLSPELRRMGRQSLAFGATTWPHQLVRVMLLEQLYRAATMLAGHPYHRA